MTELFQEEESLIDDDESCVENEGEVDLLITEEAIPLDARRRLENLLDEKRLLEELDDFLD